MIPAPSTIASTTFHASDGGTSMSYPDHRPIHGYFQGVLDDQAVPDSVFRHSSGLDEMQEVVGAAGLGAGAGEAVSAEGLATDHRSGDPTVHVEVADGGAIAHVADRCGVAREQPAGQREGEPIDDITRLL